jgi:hypothetical protein
VGLVLAQPGNEAAAHLREKRLWQKAEGNACGHPAGGPDASLDQAK